jgi:hypothetical protein
MRNIQNVGSVEDIKCSLRFICPEEEARIRELIAQKVYPQKWN